MASLAQLQQTERKILNVAGELVAFGSYAARVSETHPTWYSANMLELWRSEGRRLADWVRVFGEHFDPARYGHVTLYIPEMRGFEELIEEIEEVAAAEIAAGREDALHIQRITFMAATDTAACPAIGAGLEVRVIETDAAFEALFAFAVAEAREEVWFTTEAAFRSFFDKQREVSRRVGVSWYGLYESEEMVSRLGIFDCDGVSRLQSVGTARAHRRKGYARALLGFAIGEALGARGSSALGVAVETGTGAHRLYSSVGFREVGQEFWMMRYPAE